MKKLIKTAVCSLLICLSLLSLYACGEKKDEVQKPATEAESQTTTKATAKSTEKLIKIPDILMLDVNTAKSLLANKGLIPKVEYEYFDGVEYDTVTRTKPNIGSMVEEDTPVTIYVCKGPKYYELSGSVGFLHNVEGINDFVWDSEATDGNGTKGFYRPYVKEGYLYIRMYLCCKSKYDLAFYGDFGTASINDTFDKTVPITLEYDSKTVDNKGKRTYFTAIIPLSDLGVQKPTNINLKFDFLVNNKRQTFEAGFDLSW